MISQIIHDRFNIMFSIFFFLILCFCVSHSAKRFELIHYGDDYKSYVNRQSLEGYTKLSIDEFYNCFYNYQYLRLPLNRDIPVDYDTYKKMLNTYCEKTFKTRLEVKTEYKIQLFSDSLQKFVTCLQTDKIVKFSEHGEDSDSSSSEHNEGAIETHTMAREYDHIEEGEEDDKEERSINGMTLIGILTEDFNKYYDPKIEETQGSATSETTKWLDRAERKHVIKSLTRDINDNLSRDLTDVQKQLLKTCTEIFKKDVSLSLNLELPEKLKIQYDPKSTILIQYDIIQRIAKMFDKQRYKGTYSNKDHDEDIYYTYTGTKPVKKSQEDVEECNSNLKAIDQIEYNYFQRVYKVLPVPGDETYEDYVYKINQIVQFMKTIDGYNKKVYDLFLDNCMSKKDFDELLELKPIKDEDYKTYLLRSQCHKYIPLSEDLWTVEYSKLYSSTEEEMNLQDIRVKEPSHNMQHLHDTQSFYDKQPLHDLHSP